ncbi:hypothetical protein Tco_0590569 [Tanacetum coccineum]
MDISGVEAVYPPYVLSARAEALWVRNIIFNARVKDEFAIEFPPCWLESLYLMQRSGTGGPATLEHVALCIVGREAHCSTGFEGRLLGANPIPHRPRVSQALLQQLVRIYTRVEGTTEGMKQNSIKSKSWKIGERKDKVVNMAAGDSDDALVCCVENMVEYHIMDSGFGYVVLKTSFYTSWTLKDVRYIPSLKRRLILVGQLGEEGYHVGFRDQQWKVTKGSLVVAHGNKRGSLYMVEWFGETEEAFLHNVREDKETAEVGATGVAVGLRIPEEEWRGKDTSLAHLKAAAKMKCDTNIRIQRVTRLSEAEILHLGTQFIKPENDSIVVEHGLSSEITQSPSGSSDTSEGPKTVGASRIVED